MHIKHFLCLSIVLFLSKFVGLWCYADHEVEKPLGEYEPPKIFTPMLIHLFSCRWNMSCIEL